MAAKKMFPPGEIDKLLGACYDEFKLGISFRILAGQIVMQFSNHVEWVRMTSGGARKLAAMLTEKAAELDRLADASVTRAKRARSKPPAYGAKPPRPARNPTDPTPRTRA
jgi:hypothetical protein